MLNKILNKFGYELTKLEKVKEEPQIETPEFIGRYEQLEKDICQKQEEIRTLIYKRTNLEETLEKTIELSRGAQHAGIEVKYPSIRLRQLDNKLTEINYKILETEYKLKQIESDFDLVKEDVTEAGWMYDSRGPYGDDKNRWKKISEGA